MKSSFIYLFYIQHASDKLFWSNLIYNNELYPYYQAYHSNEIH